MLLNNLFTEYLFPFLAILNSAGLEILISKGRMLLLRDVTMFLLNYKIKLLLGHLGFFFPMNQLENRDYFTWEATDPSHQEDIGLLITLRTGRTVWNPDPPPLVVFSTCFPLVNYHRKVQQPKQAGPLRIQTLQKWRCGSPTNKELWPVVVSF